MLLDLGPVVGSNVSFFGEQLGCKIFVEDIFADLDRHVRDGKLERSAGVSAASGSRRRPASVDGILCWDLIDYLDKPSAQALADAADARAAAGRRAARVLRHRADAATRRYTKYIIVDEVNLQHRTYPAARGRQTILLNRDIIRLFAALRVSDSFLLKNNLREILFRKPA